jgi:hypothetical protein
VELSKVVVEPHQRQGAALHVKRGDELPHERLVRLYAVLDEHTLNVAVEDEELLVLRAA